MTPEEQAVGDLTRLLARLQIPFMLTGSVASSYHGRPRATHDADIVIDPTPQQFDALITALESAGFYVSREGAMRALRTRAPFNIIETEHASKIDLIIRRDRPFSKAEFDRRIVVDLAFAEDVAIVTAEDAILSKLEWARLAGDSERQLADAAGVVALNPRLDSTYLELWSRELGVHDLWMRIARTIR